MADKWYTVSEAARLLEVSPETIRRRIKLGEYVTKKEGRNYLIKLEGISQSPLQITDMITDKERAISQLEHDKKLLEERNQRLQEQIDILKDRIKDLEADKGFLLDQLKEKDRQIAEKDRIINELMPRALPKPKVRDRWFKRLFRRANENQGGAKGENA